MEFVNFLIVGEITTSLEKTFKINTLFKYPLGKPLTKEVLDGIVGQLYVQGCESLSTDAGDSDYVKSVVLLNICPLGVAEPEEEKEEA